MDVVNSLYTQLIIRDLIGYIGPGTIVCFALSIALAGDAIAVLQILNRAPALAWIPFVAFAYLVGLAVQGLAFDVISPNPLYRHHTFSKDEEFSKHIVAYRHALAMLPKAVQELHHQQRERFVALKHATGNGSLAVVIAASILSWAFWGRWDASTTLFVGVAAAVTSLSLWFSHHRLRHRQHSYENEIIDSLK